MFNTPTRQSVRGVLLILILNIVSVTKYLGLITLYFFIDFLKNNKQYFSASLLLVISSFVILFLTIRAYIEFLKFRFWIDNNTFVLTTGILKTEKTAIPFDNIQNVYITQNALHQLLNIVSVTIDSAGSNTNEIEIPALSKNIAATLKETLLKHGNSKVKIKDKLTPHTKTNLGFQLNIKTLLLAGISENHIKSFFLITALIFGFYSKIEDGIYLFFDDFNLFQYLSAQTLAHQTPWLALVIIIPSIILLSVLVSLINIIITNYKLSFFKKNSHITLSKGIFNKQNISFSSLKIQTITIKTNILKHYLGICQIMFSQYQQKKAQKKALKLVGFKFEIAKQLIQSIYADAFTNSEQYQLHNYFYIQNGLLYILILGIINVVCIWFPIVLWCNILLIPLIALILHYSYKKAYYSIYNNLVVVGKGGLIDTYTHFVNIKSMQVVQISQTIFERKKNLASLNVFTASKALKIGPIPLKEAQSIRNILVFKIESTSKNNI